MKAFLATVIAAAMVLPGMAPVAQAAEIQTGKTELTVNTSVVAFGGYEWYVIGYNGNGVYSTDANSATLLAKTLQNDWRNVPFRTGKSEEFNDSQKYSYDNWYYAENPGDMGSWITPNEYAGSTLQQKMESIASGFSSAEQQLINARNFTGGGTYNNPSTDGIAGQGLTGQKVWSLSSDEWSTIGNNTVRSYGAWWWLRSPYSGNGDEAWQGTYSGGRMYYTNVYIDYDAVRPALSLNLTSVLFTSRAAEGGKSSATVGSNLIGAETPAGTVKFTMKDTRQTLNVGSITSNARTLQGTYSGATTGNNQYVSCILTDNTGAVKYYGKLADSSEAASGTFSIPLADVTDGSYTLKIFSEQANGDLYTDFCSDPVTMNLAVSDGIGTVSGFDKIHQHSWSTEWSSDDSAHWHVCAAENCPTANNSDKDGYAEHIYNQENTDESHLKADATCTTAATYYKSCVCGKNGTETFTVGEATGHAWGAWQSNGDNTHSRSCSNCTEVANEDCSGGTATCQSKAVCTECQTEYGEKNLNNHIGAESWVQTETTHQKVYSCCNTPISEAANHEWDNGTCTVCQYPCEHTGGEATCTQKAVCEICNSQYGGINPDNHNPSSEWAWENDRHYHICENGCGTRLDEQECSGGLATCTDKALCEECDHAYGDYGAHDMTEHPAQDKTCTQDGNRLYWSCSVCGKYYSDASGLTEIEENSWIIPAEHAFGTWTDEVPATCIQEGTKGYKTCAVCERYFDADGNEITDLTLPVNKDNHIHTENRPETPAGCETVGYTAGVYCTDCGAWVSGHEEIPATGHGETELKNAKEATCTAEGYTGDKVCTVCGEVVEAGQTIAKTAHAFKDGKCTVCGAADPDYVPATPDDPDDENPQTGDSSNLALWFTLMGVGAAGLCGALLLQKRRRSKVK